MERGTAQRQNAEHSINKRFRKSLWTPFTKSILEYRMIGQDDRIAIFTDGSVNSLLLVILLQMLQRYSDVPFYIEIVYAPDQCRTESQCILGLLDTPRNGFHTLDDAQNERIFPITEEQHSLSHDIMYKIAGSLGCNCVSTADYADTVTDKLIGNLLFEGRLQAMLPKEGDEKYPDIQLIRPLYFIREESIKAWCAYNAIDSIGFPSDDSWNRKDVRNALSLLDADYREIQQNILNSVNSVCVDTLVLRGKSPLLKDKPFS